MKTVKMVMVTNLFTSLLVWFDFCPPLFYMQETYVSR